MAVIHTSPNVCVWFSLIGRVELIPTQYAKYFIMQYIIIFHSTSWGSESHKTCQSALLHCRPILQHSCITRVVCYKRNKLGEKFAGKDSAAWGLTLLTSKRLCTQIRDGISSSYWHLKSESPAVSGIPTKEAQERIDSNSAAICSDFWGGNVAFTVQSFVPMQDLSPHARRRMTPHTNVVVTFPEISLPKSPTTRSKNKISAHGQRHRRP